MQRFSQFITEEKLSPEEIEVLRMIYGEKPHGLLWSLMDRPDIRIADSLSKRGYVWKGSADTKQKGRQYTLSPKGENALRDS